MKQQAAGFLRRLWQASLIGTLAALAGSPAGAARSAHGVQPPPGMTASDAFATASDYVVEFYPLWFTYYQMEVGKEIGTINIMITPERVSPLYHFVVAINVDTLYSSVYFDLAAEPVVVTIPPNPDVIPYSLLVLDPYGHEIETSIPAMTPGVYAFTGPGFAGVLPEGVTQVAMPINHPALYVRTLKLNRVAEAERFRNAFKTQTLGGYLANPAGGPARILPEALFAVPFKTTADGLIAKSPIGFLKMLQKAVAAPSTPPLSPAQHELSSRFDRLFGDGHVQRAAFEAGARKAHELILSTYLTHTGPTNWIHFTNIGEWQGKPADRSAITEYLQLANSIGTAAYYHTFNDRDGRALDGSKPGGYVLTFPADQFPPAQRFWSLTAYTPDAIELVPNSAKKYVVASYNPDLHLGPNGSLTVFLSQEPPTDIPDANWLPIPKGKFNIMLRLYGPTGDATNGTYVPPAIERGP